MKKCTKCKNKKQRKYFSKDKNKKDGLQLWCKECVKKYGKKYRGKNNGKISERMKEYYQYNKEEINKKNKAHYLDNKEVKKEYYETNKGKISKRMKKYRDEHEAEFKKYRDDHKEDKKKWYKENKEKIKIYDREWQRKRYYSNIEFKILKCLRARLVAAVKGKNKSKRTMELLDCSIKFLRNHLESQFKPGMTWENNSVHGWHIDHIKPCAKFNLTKESEQRKCFHYTNLQPLWAEDNLRKGCKYAKNTEVSL